MVNDMKKIKKIGEIWITPETLSKRIPQNCVVDCKVIDMSLQNDFPILLRPINNIKYEIFAQDRQSYDEWKNSLL